MPQNITLGHKQMVDEAYNEIETIPTKDAFALVGRDDTVLVDIRDIREIRRVDVHAVIDQLMRHGRPASAKYRH